ncbi:hypothetical protein Glove_256g149 [Diversispora epigaea]|uniref:Uncharacterized protein n=1 Tax=Diversispora epigaea TaxID=1348612 RepID=A0A397IE22_9GLOM|nr:hypothetical protein Glove_256g149 [Diversispora epigaea]
MTMVMLIMDEQLIIARNYRKDCVLECYKRTVKECQKRIVELVKLFGKTIIKTYARELRTNMASLQMLSICNIHTILELEGLHCWFQ